MILVATVSDLQHARDRPVVHTQNECIILSVRGAGPQSSDESDEDVDKNDPALHEVVDNLGHPLPVDLVLVFPRVAPQDAQLRDVDQDRGDDERDKDDVHGDHLQARVYCQSFGWCRTAQAIATPTCPRESFLRYP
eukprot:2919225-Rhodomonas_salina.1